MKRTFCILLCLVFLACVPTPENEIVGEKDYDRMIAMAEATPQVIEQSVSQPNAPQQPDTQQQPDAQQPSPTPAGERLTLDFTGKTESFHVTVDAAITRPDAPLPIVEVVPGDFDEASIQPFFDVLTEGFALYTQEGLETKERLAQEIVEMQQFIDDGLPGFDGTEKQRKEELKHWKARLKELQERYLNAPDTPGEPVRTVTLVWEEPQKYSTTTSGGLRLESADGKQSFYAMTNETGVKGKRKYDRKDAYVGFCNQAVLPEGVTPSFHPEVVRIDDLDTIPDGSGLGITPREAVAQAEALLGRIGITDMAVSAVHLAHTFDTVGEERRPVPICYAYAVSFCRVVNGVPVAHPTSESSSGDEAEPRPGWTYETLSMVINENGLFSFMYGGPLIVGQTLVEDSALLSLDQIAERFRAMISAKYEGWLTDPGRGPLEAIDIRIDRVELCLQRVAQPDNIDGGLLVPVWNFYGTMYDTHDGETWDGTPWPGTPLVTLNAVNGSLIDPHKGY